MADIRNFLLASAFQNVIDQSRSIILAHFKKAVIEELLFVFLILWIKSNVLFAIQWPTIASKPNIISRSCKLLRSWSLFIKNVDFLLTQKAWHQENCWLLDVRAEIRGLNPKDLQNVAIFCTSLVIFKVQALRFNDSWRISVSIRIPFHQLPDFVWPTFNFVFGHNLIDDVTNLVDCIIDAI